MKVRTNISRVDLVKFNLSVIPRMRSTYTTALVFAVLVAMYFLWRDGQPITRHEWIDLFIVSISGGVGAIIGGSIFSIVGIVLTADSKNGTLGEHFYELLDDGLFEKTEANESLSKWSGILEISENSQYLLIRISSYLFHIIPKSSFSTESEYLLFRDNAKRLFENAHNK